jgi:hypothetical protein
MAGNTARRSYRKNRFCALFFQPIALSSASRNSMQHRFSHISFHQAKIAAASIRTTCHVALSVTGTTIITTR